MAAPDVINAGIYLVLAFSVSISIRKVLIDKLVRGVSWYTLAGFFSRSCWNLYFYTYLKQWYSLIGVSFLAMAELTYICLLIYYSREVRQVAKETITTVQTKTVETIATVQAKAGEIKDKVGEIISKD